MNVSAAMLFLPKVLTSHPHQSSLLNADVLNKLVDNELFRGD